MNPFQRPETRVQCSRHVMDTSVGYPYPYPWIMPGVKRHIRIRMDRIPKYPHIHGYYPRIGWVFMGIHIHGSHGSLNSWIFTDTHGFNNIFAWMVALFQYECNTCLLVVCNYYRFFLNPPCLASEGLEKLLLRKEVSDFDPRSKYCRCSCRFT